VLGEWERVRISPRLLGSRTDDSVIGVVELQSVSEVVELRCAGRFGAGRCECLSIRYRRRAPEIESVARARRGV
jgi:hypothetical protein